MFRNGKFAVAAAILLSVVSGPIAAQNISDGSKFLSAVRKRDGATVEAVLAGSGTRLVNTKDVTSGEAALHIVARGRDLNWLRYMLGKGARPDIANKEGETALILATQLGWLEGVTTLLSTGAKVDQANSRGETPLILAVHNRNVPMIRLLLAEGADPRKADRIAGYSALDYAKRDDRSGGLAKILEARVEKPKAVAGPPR